MVNYVILPNQLFERHAAWTLGAPGARDTVYLYEHPVYFTKYPYHKLKLVFHRASMKKYASYLRRTYGCTIVYVEFRTRLPVQTFHAYDPVDHDVRASFAGARVSWYENPAFILDTDGVRAGLAAARTKSGNYTHASFYKWMRKRYDILMTSTGKPVGGSWSYDTENRQPFPDNIGRFGKPVSTARVDADVAEAQRYVRRHFARNPGSETSVLYAPIKHAAARARLRAFIRERLACFGEYEDAVHSDVPFGCHSVLSSSLNAGLIAPMTVVDAVITHATTGGRTLRGKLLHSVEGFMRQIIGWREYVRALYVVERVRLEFTGNWFENTRKLDRSVWYAGTGSTDVTPVDDMIQKALKYSYLHHIERLMFVGGFMLISGIHPKEVFEWFISVVSLDAYPWVMYPNVYGMSQHSAGSIMMGKPYFSSSNYIAKMSNYSRSDDWAGVWDALYYQFIQKNSAKLAKNYSWAAQVRNWQRKSVSEKARIQTVARAYLK